MLAFAPDLDGADADERTDAAREFIDDLAVTDIDGRPNPVCAGFLVRVDGRQPETSNTRPVEELSQRRMDVVCMKFENEHGANSIFCRKVYQYLFRTLFFLPAFLVLLR